MVIKARTMYFSVIIFKYFLEAQILNIHDLNANLNYLSSNLLSLCKTTFKSVFVGKKIIKIAAIFI
jgi:hypothetical protein